jgi:hypothetical protein
MRGDADCVLFPASRRMRFMLGGPTECFGSYAELHRFVALFGAITGFAPASGYQPDVAGPRRSKPVPSLLGGAPPASPRFAGAGDIGCCLRHRGGAAPWAPITFPVSEFGAKESGAWRFASTGKAMPAGTVRPALRGMTSGLSASCHKGVAVIEKATGFSTAIIKERNTLDPIVKCHAGIGVQKFGAFSCMRA